MKGLIFSIKTGLKNLQIQANLLKKRVLPQKIWQKMASPLIFSV